MTADVSEYGWRKVRAPKSRALGNTQSGRPEGKCHRNDTARRRLSPERRRRVRVKWWGKSPPAAGRPADQANPARSKTK